jgi:hypothetical protein
MKLRVQTQVKKKKIYIYIYIYIYMLKGLGMVAACNPNNLEGEDWESANDSLGIKFKRPYLKK